MVIPALGITGRSGSGKTTLLEKLLAELVNRGYRVGVVKHTFHAVETDREGTDTRRFWEAGAACAVLVSPDRVMQVRREAEAPLEAVLAGIQAVDLILVEGYKRSALEKIEVVRRACDPVPIPDLTGRIAFVTDIPELSETGPCFGLEDVAAVADFVVARIRST